MPSSTVEDYLKAIHSLGGERTRGGLVPVGRVAASLELTPGTATTMMKHLEKEGFIEYQPRKGVSLTERGREAALQVVRRHRLVELFLVEVMHLDWAHVHEEAEVLEHALSDRLVERIDEMLGHPEYDPHGDPIPDARGVLKEDGAVRLLDVRPGRYRLIRVTRDEPGFLRWLQDRGLRPGTCVDFIDRDPPAGVLEIRVADTGESIRLGDSTAAALLVADESGGGHTVPAPGLAG